MKDVSKCIEAPGFTRGHLLVAELAFHLPCADASICHPTPKKTLLFGDVAFLRFTLRDVGMLSGRQRWVTPLEISRSEPPHVPNPSANPRTR